MAKKTVKFDPYDGLIVGEVGPWAVEKHDRVRRYIQAARGARAKFLAPKGNGGATYIELYSGAGRSLIKDTNQIIDGSAVVAFKAGRDSGHPFSQMHLSPGEAACRKARTAFFFKQWGGVRKKSAGRHYRGRTFDEMPRSVAILQKPNFGF
jgi:hypothetical protein